MLNLCIRMLLKGDQLLVCLVSTIGELGRQLGVTLLQHLTQRADEVLIIKEAKLMKNLSEKKLSTV